MPTVLAVLSSPATTPAAASAAVDVLAAAAAARGGRALLVAHGAPAALAGFAQAHPGSRGTGAAAAALAASLGGAPAAPAPAAAKRAGGAAELRHTRVALGSGALAGAGGARERALEDAAIRALLAPEGVTSVTLTGDAATVYFTPAALAGGGVASVRARLRADAQVALDAARDARGLPRVVLPFALGGGGGGGGGAGYDDEDDENGGDGGGGDGWGRALVESEGGGGAPAGGGAGRSAAERLRDKRAKAAASGGTWLPAAVVSTAGAVTSWLGW